MQTKAKHIYIDKNSARLFVGRKLKHMKPLKWRELGETMEILAYGKNYFMVRYKGASPFCLSLTEVNNCIKNGEVSVTESNGKPVEFIL